MVNTVFDVENMHRFNQQHRFVHSLNQVYFDPPPLYDEIILDIRLANPNTVFMIQYSGNQLSDNETKNSLT